MKTEVLPLALVTLACYFEIQKILGRAVAIGGCRGVTPPGNVVDGKSKFLA